ncbi:hypothetical protein [Metallosphaera sp.]|uniref:hypothetical protein n=1 Tax=Metallosphaera sp. TaxID=2020860 RepID=UPI00316C32F6
MTDHTLRYYLRPRNIKKPGKRSSKYDKPDYTIVSMKRDDTGIEIVISYTNLPDSIKITDEMINDCILHYKIDRLVIRKDFLIMKLVPGQLRRRRRFTVINDDEEKIFITY